MSAESLVHIVSFECTISESAVQIVNAKSGLPVPTLLKMTPHLCWQTIATFVAIK